METMNVCRSCGKTVGADAPQGLCPECLIKAGLGSGVNLPSGDSAPEIVRRFVPPEPEELGRRFPQLEVFELLGKGGMGAVYRARQKGLDRQVALKVLPPEIGNDQAFAERFAREAKSLARLNHPGIVSVYDFGQAGGYFYFIMEFMDGANLRQLLRTHKLAPREALAIVPKICEALQYAHDEGIVHRDIKPENILLDKKGRLKIADFGLAKLLGGAPADTRITRSQEVMGTLHYMAPEQFERPMEVDHRADIYSLGVVFYEMLTGELPMGRFEPPSHKAPMDVRLDEVVLRSLEKAPERRYQHVDEVKTQVETIAGAVANLPPHLRGFYGFEYKSKTTLFGLPLVHMATGFDPATGRKRVAKGIFAYGDVACGVVAFGGVAYGGLVFGGLGFGVFPIAGVAIGLFALGGLAISLLVALGGVAVSAVATGGLAVGYFAQGGLALGVHASGSNGYDPVCSEFFRLWYGPWVNWLMVILISPTFIVPLVSVFIGRVVNRRQQPVISRNEAK
jgi:predicted Ser/Thr protein kinase